jgi:hypothetical protein
VSIDIADMKGPAFRFLLCSAERLSESAIARGLLFAKTRGSSRRASLSRVTRCDHRRDADRLAAGRRGLEAFFTTRLHRNGSKRCTRRRGGKALRQQA